MTLLYGRHVEHDPRSRSAVYAAEQSSIRSVSHAHYGSVLNQGSIGACTGNALIQAIACRPLHKRGERWTEEDALRIYKRASSIDGVPGEYPPIDTGSTGLAACKAAKEEGLITAYHHAFGIQEVLGALVVSPVMIGTNWTQDMFYPDVNGFVRPTGNSVGGHEYTLVGISAHRKYVTALNSWSDAWGLRGKFRMSFETLDALLRDQGDAIVPIR